MSYIVSARKYRPSRFDEVVGQEHVGQTLKNALKNKKLAHAFLFCGPRGVGKTTCARILAKVLNCENVTEDFEPCNTCERCEAANKNVSFNVIELDAASNNSVEHIRQLIEQVRFQPQQGKYKVFIIDEVHMLSASAFNAFLKTLEEPPPYAIFILATTEKHKILPTILSRCQIFDFKRIQVQQMVTHLQNICEKEGIEAEKEALHVIAQKADGALRDALSIFDRMSSSSDGDITYDMVIANLNVLDYDYFFRFTDAILSEHLPDVLNIFNDIVKNGFEPDLFINGLAEHFRNLLVCKDPATVDLMDVSEALKTKYREQAKISPSAFLLTALNIANDCDLNYKMARNKRLHVEMALIKMTFSNRAVEIAATTPPTTTPPEKKNPDHSEVTAPQSPEKRERKSAKKVKKPKETPKVEEPSPTELKLPDWKPSAPPVTPKLKKLEDLMAEVSAEQPEEKTLESELKLEDLQNAWSAFAESKDVHVKTIMDNASLRIEGHKIIPIVGSTLAKNTLLQENDLMEHLRAALKFKDLVWEIEINPDKSIANQLPKPPRPLTPKEKFKKMVEINPLIKEAFDRFDLKNED